MTTVVFALAAIPALAAISGRLWGDRTLGGATAARALVLASLVAGAIILGGGPFPTPWTFLAGAGALLGAALAAPGRASWPRALVAASLVLLAAWATPVALAVAALAALALPFAAALVPGTPNR